MTDQPKAAADIRPEPETVPPPPGWYDDESGNGKRWWNGKEWSDVRQSKPDRDQRDNKGSGLSIVGYFLAVFAPLIGFIIGLVLAARGERDGTWVIVLSLVFGFLYMAFIL